MAMEFERADELEKGRIASSNMNSKEQTRYKINEMLDKIEDEDLLNRVYRFIKYIYIHQT